MYKVVIHKIETKSIVESVYVPDSGADGKGAYQRMAVDKAVEREIFQQTIDSLDLTAVIRAVNGL